MSLATVDLVGGTRSFNWVLSQQRTGIPFPVAFGTEPERSYLAAPTEEKPTGEGKKTSRVILIINLFQPSTEKGFSTRLKKVEGRGHTTGRREAFAG